MSTRTTGAWLAWLAVLAHLVQVTHFAAVSHEIGPDGRLHHAHFGHGHEHDHHHGHGHPGDDSPDDGDAPEGDHRCPLQPPALDPCDGDPELELASTPVSPLPARALREAPLPVLAPLTLAPKHSPPVTTLTRS